MPPGKNGDNMKEEIRLRKFLSDLDQMLQENVDCYIDEVGKPLPCPNDEVKIYDWIMKTEDYHLLTEETVKAYIHLFMTDFKSRMCILHSMQLI